MDFRRSAVLLLLGAVFAACSDDRQPAPMDPVGSASVASARIAAECDLRDAKRDARSFFDAGSDERKAAVDVLGEMEEHCTAGDDTALDDAAWSVVGLVETALEHRAGPENDDHAPVGSDLVNAVLACTAAGGSCREGDGVGIDFTGSLGAVGLFAAVGDGTDPVLAREAVPFVDWNESPAPAEPNNGVLWGLLASTGGWSQVVTGTPGQRVLFYGSPAPGALAVTEESFGVAEYELNVFPEKTTPDQITVVSCLLETVHSHPPDGEEGDFVPRVQREAAILQGDSTDACDALLAVRGYTAVQHASLLGSLIELLPRPVLALVSDRGGVGGTAGSLTNFSRFAPVAAGRSTELVVVDGPSDADGQREVVGRPFDVVVLARTAGGATPLEAVEVTLTIEGNNGQGAVFSDGSTELRGVTAEDDGIVTFTTSILKPGGYVLCARGSLDGFQVSEACTELFHVRNDS